MTHVFPHFSYENNSSYPVKTSAKSGPLKMSVPQAIATAQAAQAEKPAVKPPPVVYESVKVALFPITKYDELKCIILNPRRVKVAIRWFNRMHGWVLQVCEDVDEASVFVTVLLSDPPSEEALRSSILECLQYLETLDVGCVKDANKMVNQSSIAFLNARHIVAAHSDHHKNAVYYCRICDYHLNNTAHCKDHIISVEHMKEEERFEERTNLLKKTPSLSLQQQHFMDEQIKRILEEKAPIIREGKSEQFHVSCEVREKLENILKEMSMADHEIGLFGSVLVGTERLESDVNIFVSIGSVPLHKADVYMERLCDSLKTLYANARFEYKRLSVKFTVGDIRVDVQWKITEVNLSRELKMLCAVCPQLPYFLRWIRMWFKCAKLIYDQEGQQLGLPIYAADLFAVHFLQRFDYLPVIHKSAPTDDSKQHDPFAQSFEDDPKKIKVTKTSYNWCFGKLFAEFLRYYVEKFYVICVQITQKEELFLTDQSNRKNRLTVLDPYRMDPNVTRNVPTQFRVHMHNVLLQSFCHVHYPKVSENVRLFQEVNKSPIKSKWERSNLRSGRKESELRRATSLANKFEKMSVKEEATGSAATTSTAGLDIDAATVVDGKNKVLVFESSKLVEKSLDEPPKDVITTYTHSTVTVDAVEESDQIADVVEEELIIDADADAAAPSEGGGGNGNGKCEMVDTETQTMGRVNIANEFDNDDDFQFDDILSLAYSRRSLMRLSRTNPIQLDDEIKALLLSLDLQKGDCPAWDSLYWEKVQRDEEVQRRKEEQEIAKAWDESAAAAIGESSELIQVNVPETATGNGTSEDGRSSTSTQSGIVASGEAVAEEDVDVVKTNFERFHIEILASEGSLEDIKKQTWSVDLESSENFTGGYVIDTRCSSCDSPKHIKDFCPHLKIPEYSPIKTPLTAELSEYLSTVIDEDCQLGRISEERYNEVLQVVNQLACRLSDGFNRPVHLSFFGSYRNKLGKADSDVDICFQFGDERKATKPSDEDASTNVNKIASLLSSSSLSLPRGSVRRVQAIPNAKVPIVKFQYFLRHAPLFDADISFYNCLAGYNSDLLRCYCEIWDGVQVLGMWVKTWAKHVGIGDASRGSLSSYAYTLLVIHFLQQSDILPVLQEEPWLSIGACREYCEGHDITFAKDIDKLKKKFNWTAPTETYAELFLKFLDFYCKYPFEQQVVQIRRRKPLSVREKLEEGHVSGMLQWNNKQLYIEDPFDRKHNLPCAITDRMFVYWLRCFRRARDVFCGELLDDVKDHIGRIQFHEIRKYLLESSRLDEPPPEGNCKNCHGAPHSNSQMCPRLRKDFAKQNGNGGRRWNERNEYANQNGFGQQRYGFGNGGRPQRGAYGVRVPQLPPPQPLMQNSVFGPAHFTHQQRQNNGRGMSRSNPNTDRPYQRSPYHTQARNQPSVVPERPSGTGKEMVRESTQAAHAHSSKASTGGVKDKEQKPAEANLNKPSGKKLEGTEMNGQQEKHKKKEKSNGPNLVVQNKDHKEHVKEGKAADADAEHKNLLKGGNRARKHSLTFTAKKGSKDGDSHASTQNGIIPKAVFEKTEKKSAHGQQPQTQKKSGQDCQPTTSTSDGGAKKENVVPKTLLPKNDVKTSDVKVIPGPAGDLPAPGNTGNAKAKVAKPTPASAGNTTKQAVNGAGASKDANSAKKKFGGRRGNKKKN